MNAIAEREFKGNYLIASILARLSGEDRWLKVRFCGTVPLVADLTVKKYWILKADSTGIEEGFWRLFQVLLRPGDCVYDVGANWGFFTFIAAALVGESGSVTAFEPGAESVRQLENHKNHAGVRNVRIQPCAVAGQSGREVKLTVPRPWRSDTGCHLTDTSNSNGRTQTVRTLALDDYWGSCGSPHVRLLKIDTEGAELGVLQGANRLLSGRHCDCVLVETEGLTHRSGAPLGDPLNLLVEYGYRSLYYCIDRFPFLLPLEESKLKAEERINVCAVPQPFDPETLAQLQGLRELPWTIEC